MSPEERTMRQQRLGDAFRKFGEAVLGAPLSGPYVDLVGVADIAERLHVTPSNVTNWVARAETNGFPADVHRVRATKLYRWSEVKAWWESYTPQRQRTKPGRLDGGC